jgi:hypothetical protein
MENKKKTPITPKATKTIKVDEVISQADKEFVDLWFANGFNGRLAYKSLHPKVSNETAEVSASRLLSKDKVQDYIDTKRETIRKSEEIKLSYIIEELYGVINTSKGSGSGEDRVAPDSRSLLQALQQLTKIAGFDAPKKIDQTITVKDFNIGDILSFEKTE